MRASWGVSTIPTSQSRSLLQSRDHTREKEREVLTERLIEVEKAMGVNLKGRKSSLPLTPPDSPAVLAQATGVRAGAGYNEVSDLDLDLCLELEGAGAGLRDGLEDRVVILYVGRM
jgi:hypothetical protein